MESKKIFESLKSVLDNHASELLVVHAKEDNFYLNTPKTKKDKKGEFFGAVQVKKNYVAFHLMPVYYFPELLDNISEDLKSKMQGKSCFNFKRVNPELFKEIEILTDSCFKKYKAIDKV